MTVSTTRRRSIQIDRQLLGIYLNDHLAGATTGVELIRRASGALRGTPAGGVLERLAVEIAEDRDALLRIMEDLGVGMSRLKVCTGWLVEKIGRAKLNGRLLDRSPLSSLVEVEMMRLGVEGKAAGWRSLRLLAGDEPRLDAPRLEALLERAGRQATTLQELHARMARTALAGLGAD